MTSNSRLAKSPSKRCRERLVSLLRDASGPKPRFTSDRNILTEISWLSAVILLLHFTPHRHDHKATRGLLRRIVLRKLKFVRRGPRVVVLIAALKKCQV